jgi:hypothetical protein
MSDGRGDGMRRLMGAVLGFLNGGGVVLALGLALPSVFSISQAEGAYAMGVVFFWAPMGAVVGAIVGLILGNLRS